MVGATFCHEPQHFALPRSQFIKWVVHARPADEQRHDARIDDELARGDPADAGRELLKVLDAILEQVTGSPRAILDERERVVHLNVLREHQHADGGMSIPDGPSRHEPLVAMLGRHPDVDDRNVRSLSVDEREQAVRVGGLTRDVEPPLGQEASETFPEQQRVVGERYAHGSSAVSAVPRPAELSMLSRPSSEATRSESPRRPVPAPIAAPPTPSSRISTISDSARRVIEIVTARRRRVLDRVRQRLGHDVVDPDLGRGREPAVRARLDLDGQR